MTVFVYKMYNPSLKTLYIRLAYLIFRMNLKQPKIKYMINKTSNFYWNGK